MVWVNVLALGQDYWRLLAGLTAADGRIEVSAAAFEQQFREAVDFSLMELRWPLSDCDDEIIVGIEGGAEFISHRDVALAAPHLWPWARAAWTDAQNALFASTMRVVSLEPAGASIAVDLTVEPGASTV